MTDKTTLLALADRCEAAPPEQQSELFAVAWCLMHPAGAPIIEVAPLRSMLACGAYVDAALTLVPEGWDFVQVTYSKGRTFVTVGASRRPVFAEGDASTPALAITAAALRAQAEEIE